MEIGCRIIPPGPISVCKTLGFSIVMPTEIKSDTENQEGKGSVRLHTSSERERVLIRGESGIKEILLDERQIKQIF